MPSGTHSAKARLAALANNQQFINEAGLFLVWVADLGRARRVAERENAPLDGADYLETTIIGFVDTALAAQNAVVASESLGLGTVFVGALRNKPLEVADELGLPPHTIATFGLAVGVPDPTENAGIKPRLPQEAVLHQEQYDAAAADAHITGYDEVAGRLQPAARPRRHLEWPGAHPPGHRRVAARAGEAAGPARNPEDFLLVDSQPV